MRHLFSVLALVAVAAPAAAQPAPWQPERVTAGWVFTPSVAFGITWDDNATVVQENTPQQQELVGIVSPRGEVAFLGKRTKFLAGYAGSYENFRNLPELNRYGQNARLNASQQLTPRLRVDARSSARLTPTTDEVEIAGLPYARIGTRQVDGGGGFRYDLSRRTALDASYTFQWMSFERGTASSEFGLLPGGHIHNPIVQVLTKVSPRIGVGASWQYSFADLDGGAQQYDVHSGLAHANWQMGPNTSLTGAFGVAHLSVQRTGETRTGPSYRAGIEHHFPGATASARYSRTYVPSFGFGGLTSTEGWGAAVNVPMLHNRLGFVASVSQERSDPLGLGGTNIALNSTWTHAVLSYGAARWLRVEGFYSGKFQTSSARGRVERTRIGVQFVTFKPVRIE